MKRVGGLRRKTRGKFRKSIKEKGFLPITRFLQEFKENDIVTLKAFSSYQKGMYHPRFHGRTGKIVGKQGKCYYVELNDGKKSKRILVHPVHLILLKKVGEGSN